MFYARSFTVEVKKEDTAVIVRILQDHNRKGLAQIKYIRIESDTFPKHGQMEPMWETLAKALFEAGFCEDQTELSIKADAPLLKVDGQGVIDAAALSQVGQCHARLQGAAAARFGTLMFRLGISRLLSEISKLRSDISMLLSESPMVHSETVELESGLDPRRVIPRTAQQKQD